MPPSLLPVLQGASDQTESRRLVTQGRRRAKRGFVPGDDRATLLCQDICLEVGDRAVEIGEPAVRVLHLAGERIAVDRVDGEVTARGRVEDGEGRSEAIANARCPSPSFDSRRGSATSMS